MTSHLVEGRPLPDAVAGHIALELCNTKALWGLPDEKEYLTDFTALVLWAREHDLITVAEASRLRTEPAARQHVALQEVRALRAVLYATVTATRPPVQDLAGFVARAAAHASYRESHGRLQLYVPASPAMLVDRAALEAHRLIEQYGPSAVGLCASPRCGWVFLDPPHRRRWCIMAVCGNRAKARRYADRRRVTAHTQ